MQVFLFLLFLIYAVRNTWLVLRSSELFGWRGQVSLPIPYPTIESDVPLCSGIVIGVTLSLMLHFLLIPLRGISSVPLDKSIF